LAPDKIRYDGAAMEPHSELPAEGQPPGQTQPQLVVRLLGEFVVTFGDKPLRGLAGDRPQSLLAYLLLHRAAPQSRRYLSFLLWPDSTEAQARNNLRNLLFTLRQALPNPDAWLAADAATIQWRTDAALRFDVADFQAAIAEARGAAQAPPAGQQIYHLEAAVAAYSGDLLPGCYDDWLLAEREQLRQEYAAALTQLVALWEGKGEYAAALRPAQRLLQVDALNEAAYVQLMRLHALLGDRAAVQRLYQNCVVVLQRELDVEPAPATQKAYQASMRLAPAPVHVPARLDAPASTGPDLAAVVSPPGDTNVPGASPRSEAAETAPEVLAGRVEIERAWRPRALPAAATPFLGRELELAEIAERIADPHCRLLTLLGPGGIGKTRLALQAAIGHQQVFADGVAFVSLGGAEETPQPPARSTGAVGGSTMASALAGALHAPFRDSEDALTQLVSVLRPRELLLVLDNCEYLTGEVSLLAELLAAAPGCKMLVTSRQQLNLVEEWVYEVPGLPLPTGLDDADNSAVVLFERSARRSSAGAPDAVDRAAIVEICRLVGGMPLAIELAAGWVRLLSCVEIAAEVRRSLDVLAATQRNLPERHRSIRAVFDYSWRLLRDDEQRVLAALSVFAGGFSREAALSVARGTLPMLLALASKSLLQRTATGRYALHELVRQYAYEHLRASPHFYPVRDRHLAHMAALGDTARSELYGADQAQWLQRLAGEHDNLRAALDWAFGDGVQAAASPGDAGAPYATGGARVEAALRLAAGIPRFWNGRGYLREGTAWFERGLAAAEDCAPTCAPEVRAEALSTMGWLVNILGDTPRARQLQLASLALSRACGDERGQAEALDALGDSAWFEGALEEAKAYYSEGLALRRRLGSPSAIGLALYSLGRLEVDYGSLEAAQPLLQEALEILQRIEDPRGVALALNGLGRAALRRGEPRAAEALLRSALATFAELGNRIDIPECLEELALVAEACDEHLRSAQLLGAAAAMRAITGARFSVDKQALAGILHQIGADGAYKAAFAEASHWSQDEAVVYALHRSG
jgi:predicted ATPase/DNA-binding SARP family transcriptional activator